MRNTIRRLARSVQAQLPGKKVRFVLMNSAGVRNKWAGEKVSFGQTCVVGLIRLLVPPHADNESAASYLHRKIGTEDTAVEWVVVRPDGLTEEDEVTPYDLHPSPIRSAIFDSGKTSRINVAHFMADLITGDNLWQKWRGQWPVIYNREDSQET